MSILKVARMGHPVLRTRARALERADIKSAAVQKLIDDMIETMEEYHGVGLAAPQVHEGLRLFVAVLQEDSRSDEDEARPVALDQPGDRPERQRETTDWEGCLASLTSAAWCRATPHHGARARPRRQRASSCRSTNFRPASRSTRTITSTACCSSIA